MCSEAKPSKLLAVRLNGLLCNHSDQTANSFPLGSLKWNLLPPGNEKIGLIVLPPAFSILSWVASSTLLYKTINGLPFLVETTKSDLKKPPSTPWAAKLQ